jgi:protein-disulfide isomerase
VTTTGSNSKKSNREHARETARLVREAEKKRQRRNRLFLQGGIGAAVIAIAVVVTIVIVNASHTVATVNAGHSPRDMNTGGIVFTGSSGTSVPLSAPSTEASRTPSPAGTLSTPDVPHVVTYIDWSCPVCQEFEATYSAKLQSLVASGKATIEIHPIAILDTHYLNSGYSTRAANVAACVANFEATKFLAVQTQFYDHQPKEGSNGLSDSQMLGLIGDAGATNSSVTSCVNNESYKAWVTSATQRALNVSALADPSTGEFGTPTVFINGKRWSGNTDLISDITKAG